MAYNVANARGMMDSVRSHVAVEATGLPPTSRPRRATPQPAHPQRCEAPDCSAAGYIVAYDDGVYCRRCFHRRTAVWRRENRAAGLCACGRNPTPGYKTCVRCRAKNNLRDWHRRMRRWYGKPVKGVYTVYRGGPPPWSRDF